MLYVVSIYLMVIAIDMFKGVNLCIRANSRTTSVMIGLPLHCTQEWVPVSATFQC